MEVELEAGDSDILPKEIKFECECGHFEISAQSELFLFPDLDHTADVQ